MRLMSFAATIDAMRDRRKTVTRRMGWKTLKPGDRLLACEKTRGVRREDRVELGVIEAVDVRREPLAERIAGTNLAHASRLVLAPPYHGRVSRIEEELAAEGLGELPSWNHFVDLFCAVNNIDGWLGGTDVEVTRIEFRFVDEATQ